MKRVNVLSLCLLMLLGPLALGEATAPAINVLVLPFGPLGQNTAPWMSQTLRSNLMNELAREQTITAVSPDGLGAATTPDEAAATGRKQHASTVLFGTYQAAGTDVRLSAELLDVPSGKVVGSAQLTGSLQDTFGLQDQLVERCKRLITERRTQLLPKPDPVVAFAKNLDKPMAIAAGGPLRNQVWPNNAVDVDAAWAKEPLIFGDYHLPQSPLFGYYGTPYWGNQLTPWGWSISSYARNGYPSPYWSPIFTGQQVLMPNFGSGWRNYQNTGAVVWFPGGGIRVRR